MKFVCGTEDYRELAAMIATDTGARQEMVSAVVGE